MLSGENESAENIQTERFILRRYRLEDAGDIFECYAQDEEVTRFMIWRPHLSIEDNKAFVKGRIDVWAKGNEFMLAVARNNGKLIGGITLRIKYF